MSQEKSHNDIFKRLEKVEIDVAVLDSKTNRLHTDLSELKADTRVNGILSRDTKTKVDALPRIIVTAVSILGLIISTLFFIVDKVLA